MSSQAHSVIVSVILASLLATGSALLLIRRGPTRRLRQLALTVALISLAQTVELLHGIWVTALPVQSGSDVSSLQRLVVAALSLMAIYILGIEIQDRNSTDRQLRLMEHAVPLPHREGSGVRWLRLFGIHSRRDDAPLPRGLRVRLRRQDAPGEELQGEVTSCHTEETGETYVVTLRVARSQEAPPIIQQAS